MIWMLRLIFTLLHLAAGGSLEFTNRYVADVPCGPITCSYETLNLDPVEDWEGGVHIGCNFFDHGPIACALWYQVVTDPQQQPDTIYCWFNTDPSVSQHGCTRSNN